MEAGATQANPLLSFAPIILMFVAFYFLLIRPQQKRQRQQADLIKNLKKGDKVVTSGGLIGSIQTLQDDRVVILSGEQNTKLEVLRSSIQNLAKV
jgi:preprotein translocase subunit YajC